MKSENYGKDIIMQGIARIAGGFLSFFAIFLFTYIFSESELGDYNLILATINIISSVATLWLSQSILRYYEEDSDLGSIIILSFCCSLICILIYVVYCYLTDFIVTFSGVLYIFVLVLYNVFDAIFRRARKLSDYVLLELVHSIGRLFPMVIITFYTHDYNSIFLSQGIAISFFFLIELLNNRKILSTASYTINIKKIRMYLSFGLPLVGLSVSNWFLTTSDRYVIKFLGDSSQVGIYSTNYSLANSIYLMFALILVNAMHPIIMRKWESDKKEVSVIVSNTMDQYLMFMLPLLFYGIIKSHVILGMFKGEIYSDYSNVFVWTALGVFVHGLSLLCHKYYECIQKTNNILIVNIVAAIFNIAANFILIPIMGFSAASLTTFLSYVLYVVLVRIRTYKVFPITINKANLLKELLVLGAFWTLDILIESNSLLVFFVEGLFFVCYILFSYHILKIYDLKNLFIHFRRKNS